MLLLLPHPVAATPRRDGKGRRLDSFSVAPCLDHDRALLVQPVQSRQTVHKEKHDKQHKLENEPHNKHYCLAAT